MPIKLPNSAYESAPNIENIPPNIQIRNAAPTEPASRNIPLNIKHSST